MRAGSLSPSRPRRRLDGNNVAMPLLRPVGVQYSGKGGNTQRYVCRGTFGDLAVGNCIGFGGMRVDRAVAQEVLERLQPLGIEAALRGHRKVNGRLMKMCVHGPCQKLLVIRFIVATAFPLGSLRTRYGSTFAFRSACAWLRTCWRPAASSSRIRPFEAGRRNSDGISPGRSSDGQPAAWATNGISTNVWWPSMARSSGSGVRSIRRLRPRRTGAKPPKCQGGKASDA